MRARRGVALLGLAASVATWVPKVRHQRRAAAAVPASMRTPALWFPGSIASDRTVRVLNRLLARMPLRPPPPGIAVEQREIPRTGGGTIRVLLHQPVERARPSGVVLWIHGGGYVIGVPEQSADTCNRLAGVLDALLVSVDYRLAPEHPFPAGLDDCIDALRWIHDQADELGIDPTRVAVGGDSAGGGMSAAVAQRAHDEGLPLAFQALLYPMLDDRAVLRTDHGGRGELVWTPRSNAYAWAAYLGHPPGADEERPYAAPGRREDLTGLAPAWVGVGELDLFYEEDVEYARRLEAAGVPCELHVAPGMYHGADGLASKAPACVAFTDGFTRALAEAVGARQPVTG